MSKGEGRRGDPTTDGDLGNLHPKEFRGIISRGVREGWLQPWKLEVAENEKIVRAMSNQAANGDSESARVLATFQANNIKMAEVIDKTERLDAGSATEITQAENQIADLKAAKKALDEA